MKKAHRQITIDKEIDDYLQKQDNASELINNLLSMHIAQGGYFKFEITQSRVKKEW